MTDQKRRMRLGELLLEEGIVSEEQLSRALAHQKGSGRMLGEVRYAARIFKPYRQTRKVSIFGSARTPEDDACYQMAVKFSRLSSSK